MGSRGRSGDRWRPRISDSSVRNDDHLFKAKDTKTFKYVPKSGSKSSTELQETDGCIGADNVADPNFASEVAESNPAKKMEAATGRKKTVSLPQPKLHFVPYLPQDEDAVDIAETQKITDYLNNQLASLLKLKPREFWQEVAINNSLLKFLDSYLHFRRRWYDLPRKDHDTDQVIVGDGDLYRRVFMTFLRMSSNQDMGAKTNDCLSSKEHTALLQEKGLLSVPQLMDICSLYSNGNLQLTQQLVSNALRAYEHDIAGVIPQIMQNLELVCQRCCSTIEPLTMKNITTHAKLRDELLEVVNYLHDALVTLDSFLEAYPPAATIFVSTESSDFQGSWLSALSDIYSSCLPLFQKGFAARCESDRNCGMDSHTSGDLQSMSQSLEKVRLRLAKLALDILSINYLDLRLDHGVDVILEENKKKGKWLVQAVTSLAEPCMRVGSGKESLRGKEGNGALLHQIEERYQLLDRVTTAWKSGQISLDDMEYAQLLSLLSGNDRFEQDYSKPSLPQISSLSIEDHNITEDTILYQSKISQVKDIFPDYGDGFISSCLEVYDNDPELVIQRILEGTLHPDLSRLDVTLQTKPVFDDIKQVNNKGKGKVEDVGFVSRAAVKNDLAGSSTDKSSTGRYIRRQKFGDVDNLLLQRDDNALKQTATFAAQLAYEDEYDDSFDDLGLHATDLGAEDTDSLAYLVPDRKVIESDSGRQINQQRFQGVGLQKPSVRPQANKTQAQTYKEREKGTPQFYVKDGKNYSYKVAGSVAVASVEEAEALREEQEDKIYGLGRGGNVPIRQTDGENLETDGNASNKTAGSVNRQPHARRDQSNHHRKDRALKKHLTSLGGH